MRRVNHKKKLTSIIIALIVVLLGVGYALLTQKINIGNTLSYDSIKWNVGFSNIVDYGGTITSTSSVSEDGKTITINCDFGTSSKQESCIVKATIKNDSTFNVGLKNEPVIKFDNPFIHTITFKWNKHDTYENHTVHKNDFIKQGKSEEVIITIKNKFLSDSLKPTEDISTPISITLDFKEWQDKSLPEKEDLAVLKLTECTADLTNVTVNCPENERTQLSSKTKNLTFQRGINIPEDAIKTIDLSAAQNNSIIAYVVENKDNPSYYDMFIQSDTQIYANKNMSLWFALFNNVESIKGLELIDTSMTMDMTGMFGFTGSNSSSLTMDLSSLDTSSVLSMAAMFYQTGYNSTNLTLDVSNFDTSSVTTMYGIFSGAGYNSENFQLDVSNFDTSKVTNMASMFFTAGYNSPNFTLDVSNFDTRNVTDMYSMFDCTGYSSTKLTLDVSNFDTSNVTDMAYMFYNTGYNNPNFTLDVSNFDTSNVTDIKYMFYYTGYKSTKFNTSITIKNPNTTYYYYMFSGVATNPNSKITVNYTSETSDLVDQMINTKSYNSNVVKGIQVY